MPHTISTRTNRCCALCCWLLALQATAQPGVTQDLSPQPVLGKQYMVVSAHPEATRIGREVLRQGGNVFDAAVAVEFALAVCYPWAGNIGGGGFALYRKADGTHYALDYRERAPHAATPTLYQDASGNPLLGRATSGVLAAGVPGTVHGMWQLHQREGKLPWAVVVMPAALLAEVGFPLLPFDTQTLNAVRDSLQKYSRDTGGYIRADGLPWQVADTLRLLPLAHTLRQIAQQGPRALYKGAIGRQVVAEMRAQRGIITRKDLTRYRSTWRTPLQGVYRGHTLVTMPPPSSGGVAILQLLGMMEPYPLHEMGHNAPKTIQLMLEAERRVFADRSKYLGDPDFVPVPVDTLISKSYLQRRMADYTPLHATASASIRPGDIPGYESTETTHYTLADSAGNAIASTTTLNGGYGCYVVVKGAGFLLNNEMDDFATAPGKPNMYGLVGGAANALEPGKRPLSSMSPTLVERNGQLVATLGSPGGSAIITTVFQGVLNVIDFGLDARAATAAPRFHHQWLPDEVRLEEGRFLQPILDWLTAHGYTLDAVPALGRMEIIRRRPDGTLEGGADPRRHCQALGD
jgi:gamma-glutamyltranspeptidase / glutathione hydrolase